MVKIEDNTITITRGDTLETQISITLSSGEAYIPAAGDRIRFALKSAYSDAVPIIMKEISNGDLILRLEAEETKKLSARRRPYVYDVQLTTPDGTVDTFIDRAELYVTEEVD